MPTLSEQIAALEAERDRLKDVAVDLEQKRSEMQRRLWVQEGYTHEERKRAEAAEQSVAAAKREAFVEGAEWLSSEMVRLDLLNVRLYPTKGEKITTIQGWSTRDEANKRYPAASPVGEPTKGERVECPACQFSFRPAPHAQGTPEPHVDIPMTEGFCDYKFVRITPADAKRIVALASGGSNAR